MEPNQTFKLLHSKRNHLKMKIQPTEWEKIFANNVINKGLIFKIYKQFMQLNIKTPKQPNQKMSARSKQIFLQRRHTWLKNT